MSRDQGLFTGQRFFNAQGHNWEGPNEKNAFLETPQNLPNAKTEGKIHEKELQGNSPKASKASELVSLLPAWQVAKKARGTNRWLSAKMEAKLFNCYLANNLIWRLAKTFLGMLPLYSQWHKCQGVFGFNTITVLSLGQGDLYLYSLSRFVIMVLSIYFSHSGHGGWIDCQCWQEKGSIFLWQCLGQQIRRSPF